MAVVPKVLTAIGESVVRSGLIGPAAQAEELPITVRDDHRGTVARCCRLGLGGAVDLSGGERLLACRSSARSGLCESSLRRSKEESNHRPGVSGSKISKVWCRNCRLVSLQPKNASDLWVELIHRRNSWSPIQGHFQSFLGL